jgi:ankyrin repeat protein
MTSGKDWLDVIRFLIENGIDPNCHEFGVPALNNAAHNGQNGVIRFLISVGADINKKGRFRGWNPLHWGASFGQLESVKLLVSMGCDFNARNDKNCNPRQVAEEEGREDVVQFLWHVEHL